MKFVQALAFKDGWNNHEWISVLVRCEYCCSTQIWEVHGHLYGRKKELDILRCEKCGKNSYEHSEEVVGKDEICWY